MPITWIGATDHMAGGIGYLQLTSTWGIAAASATNRRGLNITKIGNGIALRPLGNISQTVRGVTTIPIQNLAPDYKLLPAAGGHAVKKITMGMRVAVQSTAGMTGNLHHLIAFHQNPGSGALQEPYMPILHQSTLVGGSDPSGDGYYEVVIPVPINNQAVTGELYKDGVLVRSISIPAHPNFTQTNMSMFWYLGNGANDVFAANYNGWYCNMSDIYVTMDLGIPGDEFTGRLGPINLTRMPVKTVDAPGYGLSNVNLTAPEHLNTVKQDTDSKNPNLISPADNAPLKVKFDTSAIGAKKVLGVRIESAVFKEPGVAVTVSTSLVDGEATTAGANIVPDGTVSPYTPKESPIATITKMPSGDALTATSLANLEVVLTPA
jgi:hypothetical protein